MDLDNNGHRHGQLMNKIGFRCTTTTTTNITTKVYKLDWI